MTPDQTKRQQQIVAWRLAGKSWVWIATQIGASATRARQIGRRAGLPPRPYRRRV